MVNTELNQKQIFEKEFSKSMRGYNPEEVDEFLDIIMRDYKVFDDKIEDLKKEIASLEEQLAQKPAPQPQPAAPAEPKQPSSQVMATNIDILKRISNLEHHVFGAKMENGDN